MNILDGYYVATKEGLLYNYNNPLSPKHFYKLIDDVLMTNSDDFVWRRYGIYERNKDGTLTYIGRNSFHPWHLTKHKKTVNIYEVKQT